MRKVYIKLIAILMAVSMVLMEVGSTGLVIRAAETTELEGTSENTETTENEDTTAATTSETEEVVAVEETEETTTEEEIEYKDLTISSNYTLTENLTVKNLIVDRYKNLDLNGYTLTVKGYCYTNGNLYLENGEMYCEGDFTLSDTAFFSMGDINGYLCVEGNAKFTGKMSLTAGILELKGDFLAGQNFVATKYHKTIFSGIALQNINISESGKFNTIEIRNYTTDGVYVSNAFNYESLVDNGCVINYADLSGERGVTLEEDTTFDGMYNLVSGILDLNGHTMTINGDFVHGGAIVDLNGGTLIVNGSYRMETREETETGVTYGVSEGTLIMDDAEDYLVINGDFINRTSINHEENLTVGTIEIKGNVTVDCENNVKAFSTSEDIKIVLSGIDKQTIDMDILNNIDVDNMQSYDAYNCLNNLELKNTSEEGICFSSPVFVSGNISQGDTKVDGSIIIRNTVSFENGEYTGDVYFAQDISLTGGGSIYGDVYLIDSSSIDEDLNIYGNIYGVYDYTSDDNLTFTTGTSSFGVCNDICIYGNANNVSVYGARDGEVIHISGDVVCPILYIYDGKTCIDGNVECDTLNLDRKGSLVLKGDLSISESIINNTSYDTTVVFSGEDLQTVTGADKGTFDTITFENTSEEGVVSDYVLNAKSLNINDCKLSFSEVEGELGWTLTRNETYAGDLVLLGGELNLNGYKLTVIGDFVHSAGTVNINGGKLEVTEDYLMQDRYGEEGAYTYDESTGSLVMSKYGSYITINGDFIGESSIESATVLTNGYIQINGDYIYNNANKNAKYFNTDDCTLRLTGTGRQYVDTTEFSGRVYIDNTSEEGVVINNYLYVDSYFDDNESNIDGYIRVESQITLADDEFNGSMYVSLINIEDIHILGDLKLGYRASISGDVDVDGNLIGTDVFYMEEGSLNVSGDASFSGTGFEMTHSDDYIYVGGDFEHNCSSAGTLTDGVIEVGGNFTVKKRFTSSGNHKVILSGDELQVIDVTGAIRANFNIIELQNHSAEGVYSEKTLVKNELIRNGCKLVYGDAIGVFGWTLHENTIWDGDLLITDDTLDLNGYTLTVNGNLIHMSGYIDINKGNLIVNGDYRMQTITEEGSTDYSSSTASILMDDSDDYIKITGDLVSQSTIRDPKKITKGTIEVQGDITKLDSNFSLGKESMLVLSGTDAQTISGTSTDSNLSIGNIKCVNTSDEKIFLKNNLYVDGNIDAGDNIIDGYIYANNGTTFQDNYYKGNVYFMDGYTTDEHIIIDGNVTMGGSFTGGTIEVKGNFKGEGKFHDTDSNKIILSGDKSQYINLEEDCSFDVLELRNYSAEGVYSNHYVPANQLIDNGCVFNTDYGKFVNGITLTEDTVISGDYYLGYGELNLNGYTLTVEGEMVHAGGTINFNGGKLVVKDDYSACGYRSPYSDYIPVSSRGLVIMSQDKDYFEIGGNAYFYTDSSYYSGITNGTICIKGEEITAETDFKTYDNNEVVLSGTKSQYIVSNNDKTNKSSFTFANLHFDNKEGVELKSDIYVTGVLEDTYNKVIGDYYVYLNDINNISSGNYSGNLYISQSSTLTGNCNVSGKLYLYNGMDLNGYELSVNTIESKGQINLNGGRINCRKDFVLNGYGQLIMEDDNDYIYIGGDFSNSSYSLAPSKLSAGTIELLGSYEGATGYLTASGTHKLILAASKRDSGRDVIQSADLGSYEDNIFNILVLQKTEDNYIFNRAVEDMANVVVYEIIDESPLESVSSLVETAVNYDGITIEYTYTGDKTRVLAYEIYRNGEYHGITSETIFVDKDIEFDTEYTYQVYPMDAYGKKAETSPSLTVRSLDDMEAPSIPTGLGVKGMTGSSVTISWTPSKDNYLVARYEVYRDGKYYATVENATEYKDENASTSEAHSYSVLAVDKKENKSELSESISAMGSMPQINSVYPKDESQIDDSNRTLSVYFNNLGHSDYTVSIEYYDSATKTWFYVGQPEIKPTQYISGKYFVSVEWDTSMLTLNEYDVKYTVTDGDGWETSEKVTYYLDNTAPSAPTNLSTGMNKGVVELDWTISSSVDCAGYKIYRRVQGKNSEYVYCGSVTDIYTDSYKDNKAQIGVTYEYVVTAYDHSGNESEKTATVIATCNEDTVPPVVKSATPEAGKVNDKVCINVTASDNRQVEYVKFLYRHENEDEWTLLATNVCKEGKAVYNWDTTQLEDGTYYINMVAVDGSQNESTTMYTRRYEVDNTGVEKIVITDVSAGSTYAQIRWEDVADKDFAYFQIEKWNGKTYEKIGREDNVLGYTVQDLSPNQTYKFIVVGYDKLGNRGTPSEVCTITTTADDIAPSITRIDPVSSYYRNNIPLSMNVSDNAGVSYGVFYYSFDKVNYTEIATVKANKDKTVTIKTNLDISTFEEGSIYIKFEAYDTSGNKSNPMSDGSDIVNEYRIDRSAPAKINNLSAYSRDGYIELNWDEAPETDVKYYKIYRASMEDGIFTVLDGNCTTLNYYDTDVEHKESYIYKIVAVDIAGNTSLESDEVVAMATADTTLPEILGMYPAKDYTVGKYAKLLVLASDNAELSTIVVEYKDEETGLWVTICEKQVKDRSYYLTEEGMFEKLPEGNYSIRAYAMDKAGNRSAYYQSSFYLDQTAPESSLDVTSEDYCMNIHLDIPMDEDFSHFEIYRREVIGNDTYRSIGVTDKEECYDTSVTPHIQYEYQARVYDINGNYTLTNSMAGCATDKDVEAPVAVLPDRICVVAGMEFTLDGGECSDNVRIDSFSWDMGNGEVLEGRQPVYTYDTSGKYDITLTVTDAEGNSSKTTTEVSVFDPDGTGTVQITVTDKNGAPIPYAYVYLNDGADAEESYKTDQSGKVMISAPEGEYEIAAYKSGYIPGDMTIQISDYTTHEYVLKISSGDIVVGDFEIHKMSLQEMIDEGVDIYDPANMNNFMFEATFTFEGVPIPVETVYYGGETGNGGGGGIGGTSGGLGSGGGGSLSFDMPGKNGKLIIVDVKPNKEVTGSVGEADIPIVAYVRTTQSVSWLKEMYMVDLSIINMADSEYVIENSSVTLNLKDGLSLADMTDEGSNQLTYNLGSLAGQEKRQVSWVVRGDKPGDYDISADFTGMLMPFGCGVDIRFNSDEKISVSGYHGLTIDVMPENTAYTGENYYIQFKITNETESPLYNFTTTIGSYQTESTTQEIYVINPETGEQELYDSVEGKVYSYGELSMCSQTVVMRDNDKICVRTLAPGESIYGTYVTSIVNGNDPNVNYYKLEDNIVKTLEGEALGVTVNVMPIDGHIAKQIIKPVERKTYYGDPIDVTTGAYTDYYEALSLTGDGVLSLDLSYDSRMTGEGELGYGWSHNFESFIKRENGVLRFYTSPSTYATFINSDSLQGRLYGRIDDGRLELADIGEYQDVTYESISTGMEGYVLTEHTDDTFTMETPGGYIFTYDAEGKLTGMKLSDGSSVSLACTENQTIITETGSGNRLKLDYNQGKLVSVSDDTGRKTTFAYSDNRLVKITNPLGETIRYEYDESGRLIRAYNHEYICFVENFYDELGRVISQKDAYGEEISLSYQESDGGMITRATDAMGNTTIIESDYCLNILSITTSEGAKESYTYDWAGNKTSVTDVYGNTSYYTYDELGNLTGYKDDSESISFAYDESGNLTTIAGGEGETVNLTYDDLGNITSVSEGEKKVSYTYDQGGRLTSLTREGKGTQYYSYGANGQLESVTNELGATATMTYDSRGNAISMTDADGAVTCYEYDVMNRVTAIIYPNGGREERTYDIYGNVISVKDTLGNVTTYTYDSMGRQTAVTYADGSTIGYSYDGAGNVTTVTYPDDTKEYYQYNAQGKVTKITNIDGSYTTYTYDITGRLTSSTDETGLTTTYTYDSTGKLDMIELPDSQLLEPVYGLKGEVENIVLNGESVVSYNYDDSGNITSSTDALGSVTSYAYNCWDELISTTDALDNTTTYSYDSAGCCTGVTYPDGSTHSISYDKSGRPVRMSTYVTDIITGDTREISSSLTYDLMGNVSSYKDEMGNVTCYEYDLMNNLIKVTDGKGNQQAGYTYDCLGRVISARDNSGITTAYTYNKSGLVEKVKQTSSSGATKTYSYTYDTMGRLLSVTDPTGVTTSQSFDESGNLSEIVYPQGGSISYSYDYLGRVTVETLSIGTEKAYSYNDEGLLDNSTNGRGQETSYSYDELGRVIGIRDEAGHINCTYDANGNLIIVSEELEDGTTNTITRTYDCMNRVATYTDYNGNTIEYGYDELGNIVSLTYPGGEIVRYSYYDNGLMSCMVDGEGYKTSYTYDSAGRELTTTKADGSVETKTYNDKGYLATVSLEAAGEEVYSYIYTYDDWGNITGIVYESASEEETDLSTLTSSTMTYDECNRMVTYNGEDIIYDEDGNMVYGPLDGEMVTFQYDCRNRLIRAGDTTYQYDAEDVRIAVETPEYREEYVTDSVTTLSRVLEVDRVYKNTGDMPATTTVGVTVGTTTRETESTTYYYGNGLLYEKNSTCGLLVYHYDHLGSTKLITDTNGSVIASFSYGTYGELLTDTTEYDITLRFLYNGKLGVITDDNSLCYMRTRYYNPEIKRFINQDIIKGSITNSLSLNRYSYVEGNPVTYTDPFGLSPYLGFSDVVHMGLDLLGCIPGFGAVFDIANAFYYLSEGNDWGFWSSLAYSIPGTDLLGKAAKYTAKGGKYAKQVTVAANVISLAGSWGSAFCLSVETGSFVNGMVEKYIINDEEASWETAGEVAILLLGATQFGTTVHYTSKLMDSMDDAAQVVSIKASDPVEVKYSRESISLKNAWNRALNDNGGFIDLDGFGKKKEVKTLFRGESADVPPEIVFNEGFVAKGNHGDPLLHTKYNSTPGNFVSTTSKASVAHDYASYYGMQDGYFYIIETDNYIDMNTVFGNSVLHPHDYEFLIPGGIKPTEIECAYKINSKNELGEYLYNPNFGGKR